MFFRRYRSRWTLHSHGLFQNGTVPFRDHGPGFRCIFLKDDLLQRRNTFLFHSFIHNCIFRTEVSNIILLPIYRYYGWIRCCCRLVQKPGSRRAISGTTLFANFLQKPKILPSESLSSRFTMAFRKTAIRLLDMTPSLYSATAIPLIYSP